MALSGDEKKELAAISDSLSKAFASADPEEWRKIVQNANRRIDSLSERSDKPVSVPKKSRRI